ncbi:unnamed protein product [Durusdinium trenchii]|uniref:Transmembrane protein n=1 Tax=Durusdinium trenchii TaxID=1381693 RepID=A0ABP0SSE4_9DINO
MENEHFSKLCVALKHIVEDVVKQQIQALAEEQQAVRQELLGELQFISEMVKLGPGRSTEPKGSWPRRLPKGQSKESGANVSNELMESSSEVASAVRTPVIPKEDLEKAILRRQISSDLDASQVLNSNPVRRSRELRAKGPARVVPGCAPEAVIPVAIDPPPLADPPPVEPQKLPEKAQTAASGMTLARRGSTVHCLAREQEHRILGAAAESEICEIFTDNIGVHLWLNFSQTLCAIIVLLNVSQLVLVFVMFHFGWHHSGELWTTLATLIFSTVAVFLLKLVKKLLHSRDLNMAMQNLDTFVQDCGHGLDWGTEARRQHCRFVALWTVMMCAFIAQQVLETWTALGSDVRAVYMHVAREAVTIVLFAVSSWVAMNGAYFQFNLLLGLGKTLDCWCGDMLETQNFIGGISSWNSLQAMLKCVGREVTWCFTVLISLGYIGLFISLAASLSLFLEPDLDIGSVLLSESALLPLMYLFFLSARLVAQGALLSEKCRQIPAFVNQLLADENTSEQSPSRCTSVCVLQRTVLTVAWRPCRSSPPVLSAFHRG